MGDEGAQLVADYRKEHHGTGQSPQEKKEAENKRYEMWEKTYKQTTRQLQKDKAALGLETFNLRMAEAARVKTEAQRAHMERETALSRSDSKLYPKTNLISLPCCTPQSTSDSSWHASDSGSR